MDKSEKIKNLLYTIYQLDQIDNKFHNRMKFLNLTHPLAYAEIWDADKLKLINEKLSPILLKLKQINTIIETMEEEALSVVKAYSDEQS